MKKHRKSSKLRITNYELSHGCVCSHPPRMDTKGSSCLRVLLSNLPRQ